MTSPSLLDRRAFLSATLGAVTLGLTACAADDTPTAALAAGAPLPQAVPKGTKLVVGDKEHQKAIEFSGEADKFSFEVEWANISGGPQTLEAFRAKALDIGSVADIPPIHSHWTGIPTKIVASKFRQDPLNHAIYRLGIAPGVTVATLADLRGKKIAYSPGQAQGALVLRVLHKAGLTKKDVKLVELRRAASGRTGSARTELRGDPHQVDDPAGGEPKRQHAIDFPTNQVGFQVLG
ncbi:ABC transporter substrate-binding protein [Micromonospora sp. NPDC005220]|uniref:ABC transporter substrate-binding protein n=1 Tax=Micromonospora sp. NPDC005220 TaxID=3155589 RepID=UPI0033A64D73